MKRLVAIILALALTGCATVTHYEYSGIDGNGHPYKQVNDYVTTWGDVTVTIGRCGPSEVVPADMMTCVFVDGADMSEIMGSFLGGAVIGALPFLL